jgi:DNA-binding transcriptional regulator YiaG
MIKQKGVITVIDEPTYVVNMEKFLARYAKKPLGNEEQRFRCNYEKCGRVLYSDKTKLFKCVACGHGTMRPVPPRAHCCECGALIYANVDPKRAVECERCTQLKVLQIEELEKETEIGITNAERLQQALVIKEGKANGWSGNTLREARKKRGWSQRQLAAFWDVSKQFIQKMEENRKPLTLNALEFIKEHCAENVP